VVTERQDPPALAFAIVASWLHPAYFVRNVPLPHGIELVITHRGDKRPTSWLFTSWTAAVISAYVAQHPDLELTAERLYTPPRPPETT
jgi:hypothetical protein